MGRTISQHCWSRRRTFVYITWGFALHSQNCERNFGYCGFGRQLRRFCTSASRVKSRGSLSGRSGRPLCRPIVTASRPCQVTGIDFAGPVSVKGKPPLGKCYIAVFTCATVRAVHLRNSTRRSPWTLQWLDHGYVPLGLPEIHWTPRATAYHIHRLRADVPRSEPGARWAVASPFSH